MYGLPGQTQDMFLDSLSQCLALEPTHLSCYGLKLEPMTEMGRENPTLPDDDAQADTYLALCRVLSQAQQQILGSFRIYRSRPGRPLAF